jgi:hypothetical protein
MRIAIHEYAEGGRTAYETSNDGAVFIGELEGSRKTGKRICAFIDAGCDDNDEGFDRLLKAMAWLTKEIKKRKAGAVASK